MKFCICCNYEYVYVALSAHILLKLVSHSANSTENCCHTCVSFRITHTELFSSAHTTAFHTYVTVALASSIRTLFEFSMNVDLNSIIIFS